MSKFKFVVFVVLIAMSQLVNAAAPILAITPSITSTYIRSDSSTMIAYTVTNKTTSSLNQITINPNFNSSANLSISNNTCSSLTPGANCTFSLVIPGQNQAENFTVSPRVCAFNGTVCSQPVLALRVNVVVADINHSSKAFVGTANFIYPITLVTAGVGTLGTAISGFHLSEPAGIAVNLSGTTAYVTNSGSNQIFAIDINSNQIIQTFNTGAVPAAVVIHPNGTKLYVANFNDGQSNGSLSVLDATSGVLLSTITIGNGPWGLAISPDGNKLYAANSLDNTVSIINTANNSIIQTVSVGNRPLGLIATPDGTKVYVTNSESNTLSVISNNDNQVIATIPVGHIPKGIAVSPDGQQVYVANGQDGTIDVINTNTNQLAATINIGAGPLGIAVTPDGTQLYVTQDQTTAVAVVNINSHDVQYISTPAPLVTMGNFIG